MERPSLRQRARLGSGCCTVLISIGMIFTGQVAPGHDQRHRYRHGVIDQHVLTHRHVELVRDERVDQMPGQSRIARDRTRNRNPPAFVFAAIFGGGTDCKGRQFVEEKIQTVIVVENDGDVGLRPRQPVVDVIEALEERLPVGIALLFFRNRFADRRNVRAANTANNYRHCHAPASCSFDLNASTVMPVCCAPMSCTLRPKMPASLAR